MKCAIRYYTKSGNTQRLAEAIGSELQIPAEPVSVPLTEKVDVLFLGSSVYAAGVSREIKEFIAALDPEKVGKVVAFSTAALMSGSYAQISQLLTGKGIPVSKEEFHCRGQFHMLHRGKPDEEDCRHIRAFARKVVNP